MKKYFFIQSAFLFLTSTILLSCQKDAAPPQKTKTELITQGSWKFDHATASGAGDISSSINSCLKDNIITFMSGGSVNVDEGTDVCSPPYSGSNTWVFQSNETIVHLSAPLFPGGSNDFTLVSLTETNLVLSQVMTIPPYPSTTVEITFKH